MLPKFRLSMRTVNLLTPVRDDAHRLGKCVGQGAHPGSPLQACPAALGCVDCHVLCIAMRAGVCLPRSSTQTLHARLAAASKGSVGSVGGGVVATL
jgi:hypothetical protein